MFFGVGLACSLQGQKTSIWTGNGSDDNWSTVENWSTAEDPNGNDIAIIPQPFDVRLDVDRTVGRFESRGRTAQFVTILGGVDLGVFSAAVVTNTVFEGAGTLNVRGRADLGGVVMFNGWDALLGSPTIVHDGRVSGSGMVNFTGLTSWGEASLSGSGSVAIESLTKTANSNNHSSLFNPANLLLTGTLTVNRGEIVVDPGDLTISPLAIFRAGAEGRLRLIADQVVYNSVQFDNAGGIEITDTRLGTENSIRFSRSAQSVGNNPVVLGANSKMVANGVTFLGPWVMRAARLEAARASFDGGGFVWERGVLKTQNGPGLIKGATAGDFVIRSTGTPTPQLEGDLHVSGYVQQQGRLVVKETLSFPRSEMSGFTRGEIVLNAGATWELVGNADLGADGSPTGLVMNAGSSGILLHTGTNRNAVASVSLPFNLRGGVIRNQAGRLDFNRSVPSESAGLSRFDGARFSIANTAGLDSQIRLNTGHFLNASVSFLDGGVLDIRSPASSPCLFSSVVGTGQGEVRLGLGQIRVVGSERNFSKHSEIDFSADADLEGDIGPAFRIFGENANAPSVAIDFGNSSGKGLVLRGRILWSGRAMAAGGLGAIDPEQPRVFGRLLNDSDDFQILQGGAGLRLKDVNLENFGVVRFGVGGSPSLSMQRAAILNSGLFHIEGDGDVRASGSFSENFFRNLGQLHKSQGSGLSTIALSIDNGQGIVRVSSGTLSLAGEILQYNPATRMLTGGTWIVQNGATLRLGDIQSLLGLTSFLQGDAESAQFFRAPDEFPLASITIEGEGSRIENEFGQSVFDGTGVQIADGAALRAGGEANLNIGGNVAVEGGTLGGSGTVTSPKVEVKSRGTVSPGDSVGNLSIVGDLSFESDSRYLCEISAEGADVVSVTGSVVLGGIFAPVYLGDFEPALGGRFTVLRADSITGAFENQFLGYLTAAHRFEFENTGQELIVTVVANEKETLTYEIWRSSQFYPAELQDPIASGVSGDLDGDGNSNLAEYVLGSNPRVVDPLPLTYGELVVDGSSISVEATFTLRSGVTDYEVDFEASSDLANWRVAETELLADSILEGVRTLRVQVRASAPGESTQFIRSIIRPRL